MIPRYRLLQERITQEWAEARRAAEKSMQAFEASRLETNPTFTLDSVALNLHAFYNGVERAFEAIGRELDGSVPSSQHWHRDLLEQMAFDLRGVRPAVIRIETRDALEPYLRFRHLIRNLYTWDLDPDQLAQRMAALQPALDALGGDIERFLQFLETAVTADETGE